MVGIHTAQVIAVQDLPASRLQCVHSCVCQLCGFMYEGFLCVGGNAAALAFH